MPYKKKEEVREKVFLDDIQEERFLKLEESVGKLEETVAYLQKDTEVVEEERIIYDVMFAVTEALRAINLHSTHRLARELEEKYFGPEEG